MLPCPHMTVTPRPVQDSQATFALSEPLFLLRRRESWTDIKARHHLYATVSMSESWAKGSCCDFVYSGRLFSCWSHASRPEQTQELWCLGSCWMTRNESIMSQARVEQPDSLSSQRYPRNVLKTSCEKIIIRYSWAKPVSTGKIHSRCYRAFRISLLLSTVFQTRSVNTLFKYKVLWCDRIVRGTGQLL